MISQRTHCKTNIYIHLCILHEGCKKNFNCHKNGHYSVIFTNMLHLSLEVKFYQVFRSFFKILGRLVVFDIWWKMRENVDFLDCQVKNTYSFIFSIIIYNIFYLTQEIEYYLKSLLISASYDRCNLCML